MVEQLLVCAKSPLVTTLETVMTFPPVLVTVTVWFALELPTFWLPNESDAGDTVPVVTKPLPLRETVWGLSGASSVRVIEPFRVPPVVGVNVIWKVQLDPNPSAGGQSLVCA